MASCVRPGDAPILEIGAGNGVNFGHYPPTVEEVVALEPEPFLRGKAQLAATNARVPIVTPIVGYACDWSRQ